MVLVSNEWQNKSEDEQKSSANVVATSTVPNSVAIAGTTTTTTAVAITSTISPSTATVVNTDISSCTSTTDETIAPADSHNVKTSPTSTTAIATIKTTENTSIIKAPLKQGAIAANDNNNEQRQQKDKIATEIVCNNNKQNDNNESKECTTKSSSAAANCNLKENDFIASVLNYSNIKIMAENAKETPLKEDAEEVTTDNTNVEATIISSSHNNTEIENIIEDNNKSNSFMYSNTNTLQPSVTVKTQNTQNAETSQQKHIPQTRQEFIKSGLRTVIAAMKANSPTAAAGLQPNFLSQLELTEDVAGLQTTFKPLCSTFNVASAAAATTDTTHTKNDCNLLDANNASSLIAADSPSLATTVPSSDSTNNGQAKILLICEGNSHPFQARTIYLTPNVECMVGRLIAKSKAAENNAIFDCKVLSRKHAVIWYSPDGRFWVKDTKSSNGTFINDNKLGDEEAELHFGDIVKFGVDVVENSRKEVHGCIIACVKLYLPDGREAISIDSPAHRSQYSGEGRISYDDLHRLNLYIQETSQREKVLASKLCSIQNILDATRKNSALCWQSMITEDQLLHRIHSLEKKLSFMEKNVPENVLRNEVLKLLDDKNSYQHTAKEALRKVYQDRCDAMQMLAKMESAYTQSDNECALLRDQIMNSKQTLQDVNTRLLHLETEYNDYREDMTRQQQEAKEHEEQRIVELTEKLRERELECEELKKKISELLIKRADLLDDEEQLLEKQAIEKLDAAIADMDLGEDDDDDDDDDEDDDDEDNDDVDDECVNKRNGNAAENNSIEAIDDEEQAIKAEKDAFDAASPTSTESKKQTNLSTKVPSTLTSIFGGNINGIDDEEISMMNTQQIALKMPKSKKAKMLASLNPTKKTSQLKRVKESTIMKWLHNSDLKKNEGSIDIFKAICNENEDGDSSDDENDDYDAKFDDTNKEDSAEFMQKSNNFTSILKNVERNLEQLEAEIENRTASGGEDKTNCANNDREKRGYDEKERQHKDVYEFDENSGAQAEEGSVISRNGEECSTSASSYKVLSKNNKKYQLLKSSVNMLREAFNEIRDTVKDQNESSTTEKGKFTSSPPPLVKLQQQFISHNTSLPNNAAHSLMETPESSRASCDDIVDMDTDSISEVESLSLNSPVYSTNSTIKEQKQSNTTTSSPVSNNLLEEQLKEYQAQVGKLNEKLHHTELEAQHTLEIMQVECDDVKQKMLNLNHIIDVLKEDKKALEQVINENKNNKSRIEQENEIKSSSLSSPHPAASCVEIIDSSTNRLEENGVENDLADINITALEREEELITYKERLDEQQQENIELRNEIATLKLKAGGSVTAMCVGASKSDVLLKRVLPYGFVVLAIVVYFITTYF